MADFALSRNLSVEFQNLTHAHITLQIQQQVRVSLDGFQILGSPFTVNFLPGTVIAVRCTAVGRGITRAYAGNFG